MSTFANPAGGAQDSAAAYTAALLDLLGARDPLSVLEETPAALRGAVVGLSGAAVRRPEAEGKWSVLQVLEHLVDSETVYGYRLRAILTEDEPELAGYDQDRWAERLRYDAGDLEEALETFAVLRRRTLRLFRTLGADEWERVGRHSERGRESVRHIAKLLAAHDLVHLRQIERIRRTVQG